MEDDIQWAINTEVAATYGHPRCGAELGVYVEGWMSHFDRSVWLEKSLPTARRNKAVEYTKNVPAFVQTAFSPAFDADPNFAK